MANSKTYSIRLTDEANKLLRNAFQYRGDLSAQLELLASSLDLDRIELVKFRTGRAIHKGEKPPMIVTTARLPTSLYETMRQVAERRNSSVNAIINSIVIAGMRTL